MAAHSYGKVFLMCVGLIQDKAITNSMSKEGGN
jgi:hypothetical protein